MKRRLCLFLRRPELGRVKTRLARTLGDVAALAAYQRLVEHQLIRLNPPPNVERLLLWTGRTAAPGAQLEDWAARWRAQLVVQQGEDLGARMHAALAMPATATEAVATLVVGVDCVALTLKILEQAWAALKANPATWVFAPAEDGGYGLVGTVADATSVGRKQEATPLHGIPWGTAQVMAETQRRCAELKLNYQLLDEVWDVDEPADWQRFEAEFGSQGY